MEERCEFIWQLIEDSPCLREKMHELENKKSKNPDKQVSEIISFFREMEEVMEMVVERD